MPYVIDDVTRACVVAGWYDLAQRSSPTDNLRAVADTFMLRSTLLTDVVRGIAFFFVRHQRRG